MLDPACAKAASIFTVDIVVEGVRYHYGFEASDEAFTAEWLYTFPSGRRQTLFEREGEQFTFGRNLKGHLKIIADLTRTNSLFLSAAAQNGHDKLSTVVKYFDQIEDDTAISIAEAEISNRMTLSYIFGEDVDDRIIRFLEKIGTGVSDYRWVVRDEGGGGQDLLARQRGTIVELAHRGHDGAMTFLDLDRESAGTRRLLILLGKAFRALDEGTVLVIDELDASLHSRACEAVLALFSSRTANPKGAQLIATTHDTNLLRSRFLRRDQIWFTEKDAEGATHLYPLTDIRTRKGDNIEHGYMQGRYGAIPFAGPIADLIDAA